MLERDVQEDVLLIRIGKEGKEGFVADEEENVIVRQVID